MPQTTACTVPAGQLLGPATSTLIDGNLVVGGRALDPSIAQVRIHWSDGWDQTVPVVDTFYFAQRPGSSVSAISFTGLDANGDTPAQHP